MRRRVQPVALALLVVVGVHPAIGTTGRPVDLPEVDTEGMEPAVVRQLDRLRSLVEGLAGDPDLPPNDLADAIGELGQHYHAYELEDAAESCYLAAERLAAGDFRWPYLLGHLQQSAGRLNEALANYLRALVIEPQVPPAMIRLGQVYADLGRSDLAESTLRAVLELRPESAAALAELGELYLATERPEAAVPLLERALELTPEADRLHYPLAQAYRALGDEERARAELARSGTIGVRPTDPLVDGLRLLTTGERVHLIRGQHAYRVGRYAEAANEFRAAVAADPGSIRARINLAAALGEAGQDEEALAVLTEVLELAPGNATAAYNAGRLLEAAGEHEEAGERFAQAASYAPRDATIRLALAASLNRRRQLADALLHYRSARDLAPALEEAWIGEADVLARLERYAESLAVLENAARRMPTAGQIAYGLARTLAASPDPSLRDGRRALELAERIYRAAPTSLHAATVAAALAESGDCDRAAEWQSEAIRLAGSDRAPALDHELERYRAGVPCAPRSRAGSDSSRD